MKLIEEVQRNTNQNYRAAKKNLIIHKFEKLCKSLIEERKILVKEREDLLHECLKFKNREKALKQQIENFMMTTRELKQELILSDARVRQFELEKLAQDEGRSPAKLKEAEEKKTIKKMREQIINILKSDITVKKAARPKSEERLPKEKASSAKVSTSNLRANTQPEENESRKKKQRYSLQDMKPNPNFKIRRTSLLLNKTMDDGFKNDNDKSRNEETDAYALIEELFVSRFFLNNFLESKTQCRTNFGTR